jgi:hypothetical protein
MCRRFLSFGNLLVLESGALLTGARLGTHAFHVVLSRKPQKYAPVIKSLAFELSLPRHGRSRKRFRSLVRDGLAGMTGIAF